MNLAENTTEPMEVFQKVYDEQSLKKKKKKMQTSYKQCDKHVE